MHTSRWFREKSCKIRIIIRCIHEWLFPRLEARSQYVAEGILNCCSSWRHSWCNCWCYRRSRCRCKNWTCRWSLRSCNLCCHWWNNWVHRWIICRRSTRRNSSRSSFISRDSCQNIELYFDSNWVRLWLLID